MRPSLEWDLSGQCMYDTGDKLDSCGLGCIDRLIPPKQGGWIGTAENRVNLTDAWSTAGHKCLTKLGVENFINFGEMKETCIGDPTLCTDGFTVAFWVKFKHSGNTGERYLISSSNAGWEGRGFHITFINDAAVSMDIGITGQYNYTASYTSTIPDDSWFYITFVYFFNAGIHLYFDASKKTYDTSAATPDFTAMDDFGFLVLGAPSHRLNVQGERLNGYFSDLKIFFRPLSDIDVQVLYDGR